MGDLNGDNYVTVSDALLVQAYLAGQEQLLDSQQRAADVNFDNIINEADLAMIYDGSSANLCQLVCGSEMVVAVKAKAEKRKPQTDPDFTLPAVLKILNADNSTALELAVELNSKGEGQVSFPKSLLPNYPETYGSSLKGLSHLTKKINDVYLSAITLAAKKIDSQTPLAQQNRSQTAARSSRQTEVAKGEAVWYLERYRPGARIGRFGG